MARNISLLDAKQYQTFQEILKDLATTISYFIYLVHKRREGSNLVDNADEIVENAQQRTKESFAQFLSLFREMISNAKQTDLPEAAREKQRKKDVLLRLEIDVRLHIATLQSAFATNYNETVFVNKITEIGILIF